MKHPLLVAMFAVLVLAGCAEPSASMPAAEPAEQEITRDAAVSTARRDAASHFHVVSFAGVNASRMGRYWVVELRSQDGGELRYAVANDGSIRERSMVQ